jgi:hypothetical protein
LRLAAAVAVREALSHSCTVMVLNCLHLLPVVHSQHGVTGVRESIAYHAELLIQKSGFDLDCSWHYVFTNSRCVYLSRRFIVLLVLFISTQLYMQNLQLRSYLLYGALTVRSCRTHDVPRKYFLNNNC